MTPRRATVLTGLAVLAVLLVQVAASYHLRWVAEDAYISFRYARSLVEDQGLVFNPGERVEGYTNFLWVALVAAGLGAGIGPEAFTAGIGIALGVATFLCVLRLHRRLVGPKSLFPAALAALAVNYTWACFVTSGLETSLVCALVTACFAVSAEAGARGGGGREPALLAVAGVLLGLAAMTRPDALLALPAIALFLAVENRRWGAWAKRAGVLVLSLLVLYLPYFLWRWSYYGDLLPNPFFAKSAHLAYYRQGLVYLGEFASHYLLWPFLPVPIVAVWMGRRSRGRTDSVAILLGAYCLIHAAYVVRLGGDFMEGRFFVPILPFLYLLLERSLRVVFRNGALRVLALAALVLSAGARREIIPPGVTRHGITDERGWQEGVRLWYREGEAFGRNLPAGTWFATDAVGAFGYASRLPIVDVLGLTDRNVARQPLPRRGQPGHEKRASLEYLRSRGVAVLRTGFKSYRVPRDPDFQFAGNRYYLFSSDPAVAEGFRRAVAELRGSSR